MNETFEKWLSRCEPGGGADEGGRGPGGPSSSRCMDADRESPGAARDARPGPSRRRAAGKKQFGPISSLLLRSGLVLSLLFPAASLAEDGDDEGETSRRTAFSALDLPAERESRAWWGYDGECRPLRSKYPWWHPSAQPTGPLGDAMRALNEGTCPKPYVGFETYDSVLAQAQALVRRSRGRMVLTSYNHFVNGVCDVGEDCDAFIAANPAFFDNAGDGPFDLRPFGRSGLDPDDPVPVGRRDLLLLRAGIAPPSDAEDPENDHKVLLFWLGQHGDEWFLNYDAVIRLLKRLDRGFLDNHTLYVALMANPDGTDVVERGDGVVEPQRRNSNNDLVNFSRGADLNRWHFPQNICSINSDTDDTNPATGVDYCENDGDPISTALIYTRAPESVGMTQVYKTIRGDSDPNDGVNDYTTSIDHVADLHGQGPDRADCRLIFNPYSGTYICDPRDKTSSGELAIRANIGTIVTDGGVDILDDKPVYRGNTLFWQIPNLTTKLTPEVDAVAKAIVVEVDRQVTPDHRHYAHRHFRRVGFNRGFRLHKYGRTNVTGVGGYGRGSTSYSYEGSPSYLFEVSGIRGFGNLVRGVQNRRAFKVLTATLDAVISESYLDIIAGDPMNAQQAYQQEVGEQKGTFDQVGTRNQSSSVHNPASFGFTTAFLDIVPIECVCGRSSGRSRFISDPRLVTGPSAFARCLKLQQTIPTAEPNDPPPLPYCAAGSTAGNCIDPGGFCEDPTRFEGLAIADCEDGVTDVDGDLFCK